MSIIDQENIRWVKSSRSSANGSCVECAVIPADTTWTKSSRSTNNGDCVECAVLPAESTWVKSSRSSNNGDCVEAARLPHLTAIRDSKVPDGPILTCSPAEWTSLLTLARTSR